MTAAPFYHGTFTLTRAWPVYAYDLHRGDSFHSVTLSSLRLEPEKGRTRVTYTEQIVFLDGSDGTAARRHGTELQYAMIEKAIVSSMAPS